MSSLQIQSHDQIKDEKSDEESVFADEFVLHHQHIQSSRVWDEDWTEDLTWEMRWNIRKFSVNIK